MWGFGFVFIKLAVSGMAPLQYMFTRVILASIVLCLVMRVGKRAWPRGVKPWLHLLFLGTFSIYLPSVFWGYAGERIPSALSAIYNASIADLNIADIQVGGPASPSEFETWMAQSHEHSDIVIDLDDAFMLQYTSGTSGVPKGVILSHGNVTWNVYSTIIDIDFNADTVALVVPPLFHTGALNMAYLPVFIKGATAVIHQSFDPGEVLTAIETYGVTFFFGVPAMMQAILQHPLVDTVDLSSLRQNSTGSAPMPERSLQELAGRGLGTLQGYGLTEASPSLTMLREKDALRKLGSVGTPSFFTDVRLDVAPDSTGVKVGEIQAKGPNITSGYWNNSEATRAAFTDDGWLRTGDVGQLDDDGYLTIVDRVKDMYISGGENVYPAEIERAVLEHPAVETAAVVGVPDEKWGEVGAVLLTLRPDSSADPQTILDFLNGKLARYKSSAP